MASSNPCIEKIFLNARTHSAWIDKPVTDETLRELYDALRWGPTSANASPARFVFIRSAKAKERLRPSLAPGNLEKTMKAPVTVIVAYDLQFHQKLPKLFPHNPTMRDLFVANPALVEVTAPLRLPPSATSPPRCRPLRRAWHPGRRRGAAPPRP